MERFKWLLSLLIAGAVIILLSGLAYIANQPRRYLHGEDGTKCYIEGQEHGNIDLETALYFNSIEECETSLKN